MTTIQDEWYDFQANGFSKPIDSDDLRSLLEIGFLAGILSGLSLSREVKNKPDMKKLTDECMTRLEKIQTMNLIGG